MTGRGIVMTRYVPCCLRLTLAGLLIALASCSKAAPGPKAFNNKLARANNKLAKAGKDFYDALSPMASNKPADRAKAQGAYNEMASALRNARKEVEEVNPKPGVYADLHAKFKSFLDAEQQIYDKTVTPAWQAVQAGQPWAVINPLLVRASSEEAEAYKTLQEAHRKYCEEFGLEGR